MKSNSVSVLISALVSFSSPVFAEMYFVDNIAVNRGSISEQPASVLNDKMQQGSSSQSNDWDTYIEVSPNKKSFIGNFIFNVESDGAWDKLIVHANTLGEIYDEQKWKFQLRNFASKKWETIGTNKEAPGWVWYDQSMSVSKNVQDYISSNGRVKVRVRSNNDYDVLDIDYLALELIDNDAPGTEPNPGSDTETKNIITVGPSGSDYTSIQAAIDAVEEVDTTILVKAGTYEEKIEFSNCGSEDGYIVIQGQEGAVLSGSSGDAFYLEDCSYVKIRGLEITGYDQGVEVAENSDYIYIENNYLHHIGDGRNSLVIYVHGGSSIDPNEHIFILNNEVSYNTTGNSEVVTVNGNVDGFVIQGNYIHHNNNIGIDVIGFEGNGPDGYDQARNGLIADNIVEYISTEGGPGFPRNSTYSKNDYSAGCIYVDGGKNIVVERNVIKNCDLGIELASEHKGKSTENIVVRNNFISNSYQGNITMGGYNPNKGSAVNIKIYNNTTYYGNDAEVLVQYNTSNVSIKNNIFYAKPGNEYLMNSGANNNDFVVSGNIYYGSSSSEEGAWDDINPHFVDPKLINVGEHNLHIDSDSPAVDAGEFIGGDDFLGFPMSGSYDIDLDARISGSIDIGADEF